MADVDADAGAARSESPAPVDADDDVGAAPEYEGEIVGSVEGKRLYVGKWEARTAMDENGDEYTYFFNDETGESAWELPAPVAEEAATLKIQAAMRGRASRKRVRDIRVERGLPPTAGMGPPAAAEPEPAGDEPESAEAEAAPAPAAPQLDAAEPVRPEAALQEDATPAAAADATAAVDAEPPAAFSDAPAAMPRVASLREEAAAFDDAGAASVSSNSSATSWERSVAFTNPATGETVWDRPDPEPGVTWEEHIAYYNADTGETVWDRPDEFDDTGPGAAEHDAVTRVQAVARGKRDRKRASALAAERAATPPVTAADGEPEAAAAAKVQAVARGRNDRARVAALKQQKQQEDAAAARMQAVARGRRARSAVAKLREARIADMHTVGDAMQCSDLSALPKYIPLAEPVTHLGREAAIASVVYVPVEGEVDVVMPEFRPAPDADLADPAVKAELDKAAALMLKVELPTKEGSNEYFDDGRFDDEYEDSEEDGAAAELADGMDEDDAAKLLQAVARGR
eukprot:CAMPEP_0203834480 /NCGR_PEP_ID=MMETSP0115-20131106/73182_1 /ASSEMBLY_ACC=CAM_ASM_000227 /TAXON_ID=33651 /ORGANISM="Bicosoecid sp, Strain ms1" /LENGTH=515 /DNA_ID=CAMNT_0050743559 /DNA_START=175 /DNA_END=1719 /DNA_ORIENTATION=+